MHALASVWRLVRCTTSKSTVKSSTASSFVPFTTTKAAVKCVVAFVQSNRITVGNDDDIQYDTIQYDTIRCCSYIARLTTVRDTGRGRVGRSDVTLVAGPFLPLKRKKKYRSRPYYSVAFTAGSEVCVHRYARARVAAIHAAAAVRSGELRA